MSRQVYTTEATGKDVKGCGCIIMILAFVFIMCIWHVLTLKSEGAAPSSPGWRGADVLATICLVGGVILFGLYSIGKWWKHG